MRIVVAQILVLTGLAGCSVSGVFDDTTNSAAPRTLEAASLPPIPQIDETSAAPADTSKVVNASGKPFVPPKLDKFSQSDHQALKVAERNGAAQNQERTAQAFASLTAPDQVIETDDASLKPFVGRWVLESAGAKGKMQKIGGMLGLTDSCEIVLEPVSTGYGYKASGSSACPTSFFMLDSWVPYDRRLVLRDHMGDDILKLSVRDGSIWVGINKDGATYVLRKS